MNELTYRIVKKLPLTYDQADDNFRHINDKKLEAQQIIPSMALKKKAFMLNNFMQLELSLDLYIGGMKPPNDESLWILPVNAQGQVLYSSRATIETEPYLEVDFEIPDFTFDPDFYDRVELASSEVIVNENISLEVDFEIP